MPVSEMTRTFVVVAGTFLRLRLSSHSFSFWTLSYNNESARFVADNTRLSICFGVTFATKRIKRVARTLTDCL